MLGSVPASFTITMGSQPDDNKSRTTSQDDSVINESVRSSCPGTGPSSVFSNFERGSSNTAMSKESLDRFPLLGLLELDPTRVSSESLFNVDEDVDSQG